MLCDSVTSVSERLHVCAVTVLGLWGGWGVVLATWYVNILLKSGQVCQMIPSGVPVSPAMELTHDQPFLEKSAQMAPS